MWERNAFNIHPFPLTSLCQSRNLEQNDRILKYSNWSLVRRIWLSNIKFALSFQVKILFITSDLHISIFHQHTIRENRLFQHHDILRHHALCNSLKVKKKKNNFCGVISLWSQMKWSPTNTRIDEFDIQKRGRGLTFWNDQVSLS